MTHVMNDKKAICIFMAPAFLFFLLVISAPVFLSSYYSLLDWNGIGKGTFAGLSNYVKLFTDTADTFPVTVLHSLLFVFLSLFIQLPVSLCFALILAAGVKNEKFFRTVYFIPVIISTVVIGQLWMKIYHPDYGLLNVFLKAVHLEKYTRGWLGDMNTVLISSFVPILWQYVGYHMLLMYAAIKSISPDIFEAAKIDGASSLQNSFLITIPLITPMLKVSVTFSVIGALKVFDLIFVLTNGGPVHASEVPSTLMVKTIFLSYQYGYGSAMAVFIIAECFICAFLVGRIFHRLGADDL
ncbi:binding-protein-dependent transport systems inner membrane component [Spirochaetia bacterium]|nr:binding-protein-dependent transport systems inner membrane component [Spirochaetia bacterium]